MRKAIRPRFNRCGLEKSHWLMPSPVRHGAILFEGLQSGDVGREGELAVADLRFFRLREFEVMTRHQCMTVDRRLMIGGQCQ
jgi:hypothetical protein